jgi:hypothetical protein
MLERQVSLVDACRFRLRTSDSDTTVPEEKGYSFLPSVR